MRAVKNAHRIAWILTALCALVAPTAWSTDLPQARNHAFDVDGAGAIACLDGVVFDGIATGASALNLVMTSQVFDQLGSTLLATGDSHTFTAVGESYTFTVLYPSTTFNVGDAVGLSVSDTPPSLQGTQGDFANSPRVANCTIATAPTMPGWGILLLAILLAGTGVAMARSKRTDVREAGA